MYNLDRQHLHSNINCNINQNFQCFTCIFTPIALLPYIDTSDRGSVWVLHLSQLAGIPENVCNAKHQNSVA